MFIVLDWIIVGIYCVGIISIGIYVSRKKSGLERTAEDYFLAGRSLPWWAIGASLIAANISAEQIIGMSGQGFVIGMAIAVWELTAAIALIIVAKFFLPLFLAKKIYTMPQFLENRFDKRVSLVLSFFWLIVYIFVNLTAVLWLGTIAINTLTGLSLEYGMILLAFLSLAYSLSGGLKAVAMTDIIQVILLIFGGLTVSYIALTKIGDGSISSGLFEVYHLVPEKFDMILSADNPSYNNLPGIWILIGAGVWIGHLAYWGFNQYITQRALAAKSIIEAQKGIIFAAYLKILMPIVIVFPGICASILFPILDKTDQAYPRMMIELLPNGLLGLTFAALIAAIISSLASMSNSISTIFTMDICRSFSKNQISQSSLITIGKSAVVGSMLIAMTMAKPILGNSDQVFQYIQNFTGLFTPGILLIFLVALFWKKATTLSVLVAAVLSVVMSIMIQTFFAEFPYIHRMGIVFLISGIGCYLTSLSQGYLDQENAIDLNKINFKTNTTFNFNSLIIIGIIFLVYLFFG